MATKKTTAKFSIFSNDQASSSKKTPELKVIDCERSLAKAVDDYCRIADDVKKLEAEAKDLKQVVEESGLRVIAERALEGDAGNVKLKGTERMVSVILQSNSRGMGREDVDALTKKWGKCAADLCEMDPTSVKLNSKFLAENPDIMAKFEEAVAVLGPEILSQLFTPVQYKAVEGVIEDAAKIAKTPEKLTDLFNDLRLTKQVRTS